MMPNNAPRIWIEGDAIHMILPGPVSNITPHMVTVFDDESGWGRVKHILRNRQPSSLIGTLGDPYQAQVEQAMKAAADEYLRSGGNVTRKRTFTGDEIASALAVMRECGVF